jgi:hypothetical protein
MFPPSRTGTPALAARWAISFDVVDLPLVAVTPTTARPSRSAIHSAVGVVVRMSWSSRR